MSGSEHRCCAVVPTFDNPATVRGVVEQIREHGLQVVLVDDGSGRDGRAVCEALGADESAVLRRLDRNRGKGAAVKAGLKAARELGYTHAVQVDADGQHDLARIPEFVRASREAPTTLVLGYPVYDVSAPAVRLIARRFTVFWVALELGSRSLVRDTMIGFRVYPIDATLAVPRTGDRMDFDVEIVVRMVRAGVPVLNLPVGVTYPRSEDGGVSHFRMVRDNLRFSWMHARLCTAGTLSWMWRKVCLR